MRDPNQFDTIRPEFFHKLHSLIFLKVSSFDYLEFILAEKALSYYDIINFLKRICFNSVYKYIRSENYVIG